MRRLKFAALGLSLFSFFIMAGCGNDGTIEVGVEINPDCVFVPLGGGTQQFCASVFNAANTNVTFNILGGANFGSFTESGTTTANGPVVTYKSPTVLPSSCVVNIQAVSVQDPSKVNQVSVLLGDATTCPPPATSPVLNCQTAPVIAQCP